MEAGIRGAVHSRIHSRIHAYFNGLQGSPGNVSMHPEWHDETNVAPSTIACLRLKRGDVN